MGGTGLKPTAAAPTALGFLAHHIGEVTKSRPAQKLPFT